MLDQRPSSSATLSEALWIDLLDPTGDERAQVERATNRRLPTKAAIEEIESSSRVFVEDGAFYLSTPVLEGGDRVKAKLTTVGFVLSPERLVTLRFARVQAFEDVAASYASIAEPSATDAFLRLLEKIVDHAADALEHASAELETISHSAFHEERPRGHHHARTSEALRKVLRALGRTEGRISHIRDTLLGIGRIAAFVHETGCPGHVADAPARLNAIHADLGSLNDYQMHLESKVQFLLDATLGFISIQQNDIVKTLTIVSVVGVPPVLIAGIYGMNFKVLPELTWPLGYPFALVLIVVSVLLPLAWFRLRGWM